VGWTPLLPHFLNVSIVANPPLVAWQQLAILRDFLHAEEDKIGDINGCISATGTCETLTDDLLETSWPRGESAKLTSEFTKARPDEHLSPAWQFKRE
jgi:hypothetical protein